MNYLKLLLLVLLAIVISATLYGYLVVRQGFSTVDQPSALERILAGAVRNLSIPAKARDEKNPWTAAPETLQEARDHYANRCSVCHGKDGSGQSDMGPNLYPKPPDLRSP